jgi:ATP-dependent DNA helicase RecQ
MISDDEPGINAAIHTLVESGLAGRRGQMAWATRPDGEDEIDLQSLEEHRAHAIAKLDAMQRYAESATCLRARILSYFGDRNPGASCGNCGPCMAPPAADRAAAQEGEDRIFQQLRVLRRKLAEEANVPPYVIFSDATLRDMAARLPRNQLEMLRVAGVGHVKFERYGEAFLAITRQHASAATPGPPPAVQSERRDPFQETLELFEHGMALTEIAAKRDLAPSTIANHIALLIAKGQIRDIDNVAEPALIERVRDVVRSGTPLTPLTPLRDALGGDVPFEQLHVIRAWLTYKT